MGEFSFTKCWICLKSNFIVVIEFSIVIKIKSMKNSKNYESGLIFIYFLKVLRPQFRFSLHRNNEALELIICHERSKCCRNQATWLQFLQYPYTIQYNNFIAEVAKFIYSHLSFFFYFPRVKILCIISKIELVGKATNFFNSKIYRF